MPIKAPSAVPMFGVTPHDPVRIVANVARVRKGLRCSVCGPGPKPGSSLVCMDCHRGSAGMEAAARGHALPAFKVNQQDVPRGKAPKPRPPRLTKKQIKQLLADAKNGEQEIDIVRAFLAEVEAKARAADAVEGDETEAA